MSATPRQTSLSWLGIVRLGLVQTALGAIFVLATSTLNRVMVVELALPAALPGLLVGLHYAMQVLRPRLGYGSDVAGRRTPWIIGGMGALALGAVSAAVATALMTRSLVAGIALAVPSFLLIGLGVGAAGTALLVLLAQQAAPARRPAAAAIVWMMMIAGFITTAALAGRFLDPFSPGRLVAVSAAISSGAWIIACFAVWNLERAPPGNRAPRGKKEIEPQDFRLAIEEVWSEPRARRFAIFVFVSMLAYGGEDLLLEPFAGAVFGMTPGATAKLAGVLHFGALVGMLLIASISIASRLLGGSLNLWMSGGCIASGVALFALAGCSLASSSVFLRPLVFGLGIANGAYAVAAIGSMMQRVGGAGAAPREGVRMGLWGASQAVAFGCGGLVATIGCDIARHLFASATWGYAAIFTVQAGGFLYAATLAARLDESSGRMMRQAGVYGRLPIAQAKRG